MGSRKPALRWFFVILFLFSCVLAVLFLDLKEQALKFHKRDYPFYLQFAAKLFDPKLPRRFTINPDGFNYLGYAGTEGAAGFHQSVHLEPIRYFYAAAFALVGRPAGIYALFAILYFLPVIYFAYAYPVKRRGDDILALLLILLYVFYPLTLAAVGDDLRPRILMTPAFMLAFLAIHWRRSWMEKLAFFGLLLITREEAVILAAGLIPYELFRSRAAGRKSGVVYFFGAMLLAWIVVQYRYFQWTGYSISQDLSILYPFRGLLSQPGWAAAGGAALIGMAYAFWPQVKKLWARPAALAVGCYTVLVMSPLIFQWVREEAHWFHNAFFFSGVVSTAQDAFFLPKNGLLFAASLLLLLQIWDFIRAERSRRVVLFAVGVILLVSAAAGLFSAGKRIREFQAAIPDARILMDLRGETDRLTTPILVDYETNPVYYDYDQMVTLERLPADTVPGEERFYPKNLAALEDLLQNKVEWAAVSAGNKELVLKLLRELGVKAQIFAENQAFVVIRLR